MYIMDFKVCKIGFGTWKGWTAQIDQRADTWGAVPSEPQKWPTFFVDPKTEIKGDANLRQGETQADQE